MRDDYLNLLASLVLESLELDARRPSPGLVRLVTGVVVQSHIYGPFIAAPALLVAVEAALAAPHFNGPLLAVEELSRSDDPIYVHARGIGNALVGNCEAAKKDARKIRKMGDDRFRRELTLGKIFTLCDDQHVAIKHLRSAYEAARSDEERRMVQTWDEHRLR